MAIEHKLFGTQQKYGYVWWNAKDNDKFKKVLPKEKFVLYFHEKKVGERMVDWSRRRFILGKRVMREHLKKNDTIKISNPTGNKVVISKR